MAENTKNPTGIPVESVKAGNKSTATSTQTYLRIGEIHDNTLVLKNGGVRAILRCSSVNFNLKSEDEKNAIIYSYQSFLNTLDFPLQIVIRSKRLDIDNYIAKLKGLAEKQANLMLQKQTTDYIEYIQKLVEYADIMEKDFFVVVPYDPFRSQKISLIQTILTRLFSSQDSYSEVKRRHEEFEQLKKGLMQRVNVVKSGLENVGLKVEELDTQKLIEVFYNTYNPEISRNEKYKKETNIDIALDENRMV